MLFAVPNSHCGGSHTTGSITISGNFVKTPMAGADDLRNSKLAAATIHYAKKKRIDKKTSHSGCEWDVRFTLGLQEARPQDPGKPLWQTDGYLSDLADGEMEFALPACAGRGFPRLLDVCLEFQIRL